MVALLEKEVVEGHQSRLILLYHMLKVLYLRDRCIVREAILRKLRVLLVEANLHNKNQLATVVGNILDPQLLQLYLPYLKALLPRLRAVGIGGASTLGRQDQFYGLVPRADSK
ncbi:hypothetical protein HAX54_037798, partial [Datura stramonium]|nr:hypothetical protein [Datura stramonium]